MELENKETYSIEIKDFIKIISNLNTDQTKDVKNITVGMNLTKGESK